MINMTDQEYEQFKNEKYDEMETRFKIGAVKLLEKELDQATKDEIKAAHQKHGSKWIHSIPMGHFGFGMAVRNLLRQNDFTDAKAGGNLDDYYCQLLEAAVGLRH
jgi:hypothetical protein